MICQIRLTKMFVMLQYKASKYIVMLRYKASKLPCHAEARSILGTSSFELLIIFSLSESDSPQDPSFLRMTIQKKDNKTKKMIRQIRLKKNACDAEVRSIKTDLSY